MKAVNDYRLCAGALFIAGSFATALALATENLPEGFRKCSTYQDRDARLACFDAEVVRLSNPGATTQNFGVIAGALAQQQARESGQPNEITARVVGVSTRARGELVLTLDNGQVWEQTQGGAKFPVKVDDTVTIRTGALNSYKLVTVSGKTTKVTRIK